MKNTLSEIKSLSLLFYNYSKEDLDELLEDFEFRHFWLTKRQLYSENSYYQLWLGFVHYFDEPVQIKIMNLAQKRFGVQKGKEKKQ